MQFQVKVLTLTRIVEDVTIEASSEAEARQLVSNTGGRVIDLRVSSSLIKRPQDFNLAVFNQQMFSLLAAGQTVVDALDILGKNDSRAGTRAVYDVLARELRAGKQLSDAMANLPSVFPALYVAMVRSSETTGTVRVSIERYMQYQKQVDDIRRKLAAASTYPAILLGVGSLVIIFLMLYVLPRFATVYEDTGTLGGDSGGFVRWWGGFVQENGWTAWSLVLGAFSSVVIMLLHPATRSTLYRRLLTVPWIGQRIQVLQLARLYRTQGMLLRGGISVLAAMRMTRASMPSVLQPSMDNACRLVSEGTSMSRAMKESGLSTEVAVRLLVAGESSGNLDEMMGRIADFYDQETAHWIDRASRLIEPILMLGIGLIVGAIVLLLYSPIFDLANMV